MDSTGDLFRNRMLAAVGLRVGLTDWTLNWCPVDESRCRSSAFPGCRREDAAESRAEARVKEVVEQWIDAAVGATHPLGDGHHDAPELVLSFAQRQGSEL